MKVKTEGNKQGKVSAAVSYATVEGQGKIPYPKEASVSTPSTASGHDVSGKSRGMGAALRGGSFSCS